MNVYVPQCFLHPTRPSARFIDPQEMSIHFQKPKGSPIEWDDLTNRTKLRDYVEMYMKLREDQPINFIV